MPCEIQTSSFGVVETRELIASLSHQLPDILPHLLVFGLEAGRHGVEHDFEVVQAIATRGSVDTPVPSLYSPIATKNVWDRCGAL